MFIEGGAKGELAAEARRAFSQLFERLDLEMKPHVVACGGRSEAYKKFKEHLERDETPALLLVDAEEVVKTISPWDHVKNRRGDGWARPSRARDEDLHFMAVVMETWCLVGRGPSVPNPEKIAKEKVFQRLKKVDALWSERMKARSFELLEGCDPARLEGCSYFKRLITRLKAG